MSGNKHLISNVIEAAMTSGVDQSPPIQDRDGTACLHSGAMSPPLQTKILRERSHSGPAGNDVRNSSHNSLLRFVAKSVNANCSKFDATVCRMNTRGERLAWAREMAGYRSKSAAAHALGIPVSTYNAHERAEQPGSRDFSPEDAERYARKFQVAVGWLLTGKGDPKAGGDAIPAPHDPIDIRIVEYPISGTVEAGSFREVVEYFDEALPTIKAPYDNRYPFARHMAFKIQGDSMNRATPPIMPGGYLLCVDFADLKGSTPLRDGMKIVVERSKYSGEVREWSVKEVELYQDRIEFHPRSDNPIHKPIVVMRNQDNDDGVEIRILAIVKSVYYPSE